MSEFKVGDKVRLVRPDGDDIKRGMIAGQELDVTHVDGAVYAVYVKWGGHDRCLLFASQLERVPSRIKKAAPTLLELSAALVAYIDHLAKNDSTREFWERNLQNIEQVESLRAVIAEATSEE